MREEIDVWIEFDERLEELHLWLEGVQEMCEQWKVQENSTAMIENLEVSLGIKFVSLSLSRCAGSGQSFELSSNRNTEPDVLPLFWSVRCMKVADKFIDPFGHLLFCDTVRNRSFNAFQGSYFAKYLMSVMQSKAHKTTGSPT